MADISKSVTLFSSAPVAGAVAHVADPITMDKGSLLSFHGQWLGTGTAVGTIQIYQSDVPVPGKNPLVNWVLIPATEVPVAGKEPAGAPLESFFNIGNGAARHYLFVYTHVSGEATFSLYANVGRGA